jgi:hypothetical protein
MSELSANGWRRAQKGGIDQDIRDFLVAKYYPEYQPSSILPENRRSHLSQVKSHILSEEIFNSNTGLRSKTLIMPSATSKTPPTTLPYSSSTSEILSSFDTHGCIVLTDFLSSTITSSLKSELGTASTALASKSPTFVSVLLEPKLLELLDARLSKVTKIWHGEERLTNKSRPQLSATVMFDLPPGRVAEPLHRHDDIYFVDHPLEIAVEVGRYGIWGIGRWGLGVGRQMWCWGVIGGRKIGMFLPRL